MIFRSQDERQTLAFAARLAQRAGPCVVCLTGPLGAGKTTFVRGFLQGLGHTGGVTSPTFALVNEYPRVSPRVYHLDLYRIDDPGELKAVGLEDYLDDEMAVNLIEWPEVAQGLLPADRLEISFDLISSGGRTLRLKARGPKARKYLK